MAASRTISFIVIITIAIGILLYLADRSISVRAVLPLQEYLASSTPVDSFGSMAVSTYPENTSASTSPSWFASTTIVRQLFGGNISTSTPIIPQKKSALLPIYTPKGTIYSYIARTPATRERGLSGKISLDVDQGMLFIFPKVGNYEFWMKDMDFSIDMVWITAGKKVAHISENISPQSYPKTFSSPVPVQFILEVPAGSAQLMGLKVGSTVAF